MESRDGETMLLRKREADAREGSWRKILYERQMHPDNYVGSEFLDNVVVNASHVDRNYGAVFLSASLVVQQMSILVITACAFAWLMDGSLSGTGLALIDLLVLIMMTSARNGDTYESRFRRAVGWVCAVTAMAPILRSLARTISTDTIIALSVLLAVVHLYCHDYAQHREEEKLECRDGSNDASALLEREMDRPWHGSVGISSSFGAAVLLASRLHSNLDACTFLLLALELFVLLPRTQLRLGTTLGLATISIALLIRISRVISDFVIHAYLFVLLVCPFWLLRIQKKKTEIQGPWDEAKPKGVHTPTH